jgi:hypothetical protein
VHSQRRGRSKISEQCLLRKRYLSDKGDQDRGILGTDKIKAGAVEFEIKNSLFDQMHEFLIAPRKARSRRCPTTTHTKGWVVGNKLPELAGQARNRQPSVVGHAGAAEKRPWLSSNPAFSFREAASMIGIAGSKPAATVARSPLWKTRKRPSISMTRASSCACPGKSQFLGL